MISKNHGLVRMPMVCDLQEMTYKEVANRLVELMYVKKSHRWIDVS